MGQGDDPRRAARWVCEGPEADRALEQGWGIRGDLPPGQCPIPALEQVRARLKAHTDALAAQSAARDQKDSPALPAARDQAAEGEDTKQSASFTGALVETVVNNLHVVVRRVHIRLQYDAGDEGESSFACGVVVDLHTTRDDFVTPDFVPLVDIVHKALS
eukprot:gene46625-36175_t